MMEEKEEDRSQNNVQKKSKDVHLIVFGDDVKAAYYDRCNVYITKHKITVTPDDKRARKIKEKIAGNFIRYEKVICFFSDNDGFAMLFDHKKDCLWAYDALKRNRIRNCTSHLSELDIEERFIIPMIQELYDFKKLQYKFRVFILKLLKYMDLEIKQRLADMIIDTGLVECLLTRVLVGIDFPAEEEEEEDEISSEPTPPKKPRLSSSSNRDEPNNEPITTPFQIIDYTQSGISKTHLFIFTDEEKTECFEYYWELRSKKFKCTKCQKRGPIVTHDSDGADQVHFGIEQCFCPSREFIPEKYKDDILVFKPDYKIVDEKSHRKVKPKLYVYTNDDKSKGYKFDFDQKLKRYLCIKCRSKNYLLRAVSCLNEDEEEFIAIQNKPHKCEPIDCQV